MAQDEEHELSGPDLAAGVPLADITDGGMLLGHAGGEAVLLARQGEEVFAVSAHCTHYHGPLAEGLMVGETVRCPWHHACFNLRTGEPERAPALFPLTCWNVAKEGANVRVTGQREDSSAKKTATGPESVVIVGAGAAGSAAAEMLRREGYTGPVTLIGAEDALPTDRPNLSKDYLAGNAPEEWMPVLPAEFYAENNITLRLGTRVTVIDPGAKTVTLEGGESLGYGALLLATGADPVHLPLPGAEQPHVHYLRTINDSRAIIAASEGAKTAVVIGASFIGLEVAASLKHRGLDVHVVAPEAHLFEKVFGAEVGDFVQSLHEEKGVHFHLGQTATAIGEKAVTLQSGETILADFIVIGVGVGPSIALAEQAGLAMEKGVEVNEYLETSAPGIYAAGDIARWPDPHSGRALRIEHWVVAQRQGQAAARNILGQQKKFDSVPFFWSQHYDIVLAYVGHAEQWDRTEMEGSLADHDAKITYYENDKPTAVLTLFRDLDSLRAEVDMEASL
jgi:NADPH-dependent 2,4-dienoyl-CoA reductase/sulfur reductase-like enzyme/nitrite reductase/ring-hydroxylating ferredoxin subunit